MAKAHTIQVFEHSTLRVGNELTEAQWLALLKFHERQKEQHFFTPVHKGIRFRHYVGVIQVGRLTIEILPKADREPANNTNEQHTEKWQGVLIDMLKTCRKLKVSSLSKAQLKLKKSSLLDWYLHLFLEEAETILRHGPVKTYRTQIGNRNTLKGKISWHRHLSLNAVHRERFYQHYQVYDRQHVLNQLLLQTLKAIPRLTANSALCGQAARLQLHLPELPEIRITAHTFDTLHYHRKTERYREAMTIARLLLLNLHPDLSGGSNHVIALLFDMNRLWEEFLFHKLQQAAPAGYTVTWSKREKFWENHTIEADILIDRPDGSRLVLDAKWAALSHATPTAHYLRQLYVYKKYFNATRSYLVYPQVYGTETRPGQYHHTPGTPPDAEKLSCALVFVEVLAPENPAQMDTELGRKLLAAVGIDATINPTT